MKSLKFKGDRKMHNEFLDYLGSLTASEAEEPKHLDVHAIQDEALDRFSKRKEFDDAAREKYLLREAKVFSGSMVKEWTGLSYWWDVKTVTGAMRVRVHDGIDDGDRN